MPLNEPLPAMLAALSRKAYEKICTKPMDEFEDCDHIGFDFIFLALPAVCSLKSSRPDMNTTPTALAELLAGQCKDTLFRQAAVTLQMLALVTCMTAMLF